MRVDTWGKKVTIRHKGCQVYELLKSNRGLKYVHQTSVNGCIAQLRVSLSASVAEAMNGTKVQNPQHKLDELSSLGHAKDYRRQV